MHSRGAVEALLRSGAAVDALDGSGQSALVRAVVAKREAEAIALIEGGADVKDDASDVSLPLVAMQSEKFAVLTALLEHGASGVSALFAAARGSNPASVVQIAKHVDLRVVDEAGETALHVAVRAGCAGVVAALMSAGADADAKDCTGETPLGLATRLSRGEVVDALTKAKAAGGCNPSTASPGVGWTAPPSPGWGRAAPGAKADWASGWGGGGAAASSNGPRPSWASPGPIPAVVVGSI
jgi:ankyrin repeat protein